jgi:dolichyl-phosphate beta-glucosyltransferase
MSRDAAGQPSISIVVPAFNEAERIVYTLNAILDYAQRTGRVREVIVVDDGSTDGTAGIVTSLARRRGAPMLEDDADAAGLADSLLEAGRALNAADLVQTAERAAHALCVPILLLRNERNAGKGNALRRGMAATRGDLILISDADLSAPIRQLDRLLTHVDAGFDIVIGSRDLPESYLDPPQPLPRRLAAGAFRVIRRRLLLRSIRDTQCGFKLFTRRAFDAIGLHLQEDGWLFDVEALALADRMGFRIKEVGITWRNDPASHVRPAREALGALAGLVRIRLRVGRLVQRER